MPYRVQVGNGVIECDTPEEAAQLLMRIGQSAFVASIREEIERKHREALGALDTLGPYLKDAPKPEPKVIAPVVSPPRVEKAPPAAVEKKPDPTAYYPPDDDEPDDEEDDESPDDDVSSELEKPPLDKRASRWGEHVNDRGERLLLILNQLGPQRSAELARLISGEKHSYSAQNVLYALRGLPTSRDGEKWVAGRISKIWTDEDTAMFGEPKFSAASDEPTEQAAEEEPEEEEAEEQEEPAEGSLDGKEADPTERKAVVEASQRWVHSEDHTHSGCDLCDSLFRNELICIASDYRGTKIMCKPCARRAGFTPPGKETRIGA